MHAHIKAIPADKHRYETVGDWWFTHHDGIEVRVTRQPDWRHEFLVGLHELIEAALCKQRKITEAEVTEWDKQWGVEHKEGEPGDDLRAPYHEEHAFAEHVERAVANQLDVDWDDYTAALEG